MSADIEPRSIDLAQEPAFKLATLEVHPATLEVVAGDRREQLEPRIMQVLVALARRRGDVLSRDELNELCWGGRVVGDDAVNRCIGRLRKLAQTYSGFSVETVPRVGYRLTEVAGAHAPFSSGLRTAKPSIAVLPFVNLSGDPEQSYFADGMVMEIVTALSRFPALFVIASGSSLTQRDPTVGWTQIAEALGVRYLLGGSVRRSGDRVRISVQLIDAPEDAQVWIERFEGQMEDVFALQDTVANAVAAQISPVVEAAEVRRSSMRPTADLGAYDLYLRALESQRAWTRDGILQSIRLLDEAIARDPDYGLALAFAARCHGTLSIQWCDDPAKSRERALELGRRALRVASDDPDVLSYVAFSSALAGGDLAIADAMVERSLVRNPGSAMAWLFSGWIKVWGGRGELALAHLGTASRLDPHSPARPFLLGGLGIALLILGRQGDAILKLKEAAELRPNFVSPKVALVAALAHAGNIAEARTVLRETMSPLEIVRALGLYRDAASRELIRSGLALAGSDI